MIDEPSMMAECSICKQEFTLIEVFRHMESLETRWIRSYNRLVEIKQDLKKLESKVEMKNRCKCSHCGKMTKIEK